MLTRRIAQFFVVVALFICHAVSSSQVVIYQDTDCKTAVTTVVASNGYPDGLCTEVTNQTTKDFQSFQFLSLDTGCAATVYQAGSGDGDDDACSGDAVLASLATCYNTSWVDFSVDECTTPAASGNSTGGNTTITTSPPVATPTTSSSLSVAAPSSTDSAKSNAPLFTIDQARGVSLCSAVMVGMLILLL